MTSLTCNNNYVHNLAIELAAHSQPSVTVIYLKMLCTKNQDVSDALYNQNEQK